MADFWRRQNTGSTTSDSITAPPTDSTTSPPDTTTTPPPTDTTTNPPTSPPPDSTTTPPPDSTSNPPTPTESSTGPNNSSTVAGSSSSQPTASSTTPPSSSSSIVVSTETQTSTIVGTDANGSQYTSFVTKTVLNTGTVSPDNRAVSSTSHTGAIVGGVVGGLAGAAILASLIFFFCRRRRRRDDFDGNFDPDRVVGLSGDNRGTLPDIDLAAAENITPYSYNPAAGAGAPAGGIPVPSHTTGSSMGMPDMRQYGGEVPSFLAGGIAGGAAGAAMANAGNRSASPPSSYSQPQTYYAHSASDHGGAYPDYSAYAAYANPYPQGGAPTGSSSPTGSPTSPSFGPQVAGIPGRDFRHPSPGPSLAHTSYTAPTDPSVSGSSSGPGVIPSQKEREAMAYRRSGAGLTVTNPDGSGPASSGVLQHQDGGRLDATPEDEEPTEVPPRYDTIPHDR